MLDVQINFIDSTDQKTCKDFKEALAFLQSYKDDSDNVTGFIAVSKP